VCAYLDKILNLNCPTLAGCIPNSDSTGYMVGKAKYAIRKPRLFIYVPEGVAMALELTGFKAQAPGLNNKLSPLSCVLCEPTCA
jgi:hypothetical protein